MFSKKTRTLTITRIGGLSVLESREDLALYRKHKKQIHAAIGTFGTGRWEIIVPIGFRLNAVYKIKELQLV